MIKIKGRAWYRINTVQLVLVLSYIYLKQFFDNKPATTEFPTREDSWKDCNAAWWAAP
jgi:hypothetical protein